LYILWSFGIFYGCLVYFSRFGMVHQEKSGNPAALCAIASFDNRSDVCTYVHM
jgi:hypothetical protein